jgi:hypothetical protein
MAFCVAADATPSAPLMQVAQMIDGHVVGDGPMESDVRLVQVLLEPQQAKLGHHGGVGFLELWRSENYLLEQ